MAWIEYASDEPVDNIERIHSASPGFQQRHVDLYVELRRREDVERLRAHGFADRAIHDICAITACFAFVNRIADGLGVELEDAT